MHVAKNLVWLCFECSQPWVVVQLTVFRRWFRLGEVRTCRILLHRKRIHWPLPCFWVRIHQLRLGETRIISFWNTRIGSLVLKNRSLVGRWSWIWHWELRWCCSALIWQWGDPWWGCHSLRGSSLNFLPLLFLFDLDLSSQIKKYTQYGQMWCLSFVSLQSLDEGLICSYLLSCCSVFHQLDEYCWAVSFNEEHDILVSTIRLLRKWPPPQLRTLWKRWISVCWWCQVPFRCARVSLLELQRLGFVW